MGFLLVELVLIGLLFVGLLSGSASQIAAVDILMSGTYAVLFWGGHRKGKTISCCTTAGVLIREAQTAW